MATNVFTDAVVLWDQFDFSGDHNSLTLEYGAEMLDSTTFGATARTRSGGLKTINLSGGGFWNNAVDGVDEELFARVGGSATVVTVSADGGDEGEIAYSFQPVVGSYQIGGDIGSLLPFTVEAEAAKSPLLRGTVMQNGSETATGSGTARQLGAVTSSQKLYAALHVLTVSGTNPTLTAVVRSDDNSGMTTASDRITFSQATDSANLTQWATPVDGAIADDWWDIEYTIGGTDTPTFQFVVVVAIQ